MINRLYFQLDETWGSGQDLETIEPISLPMEILQTLIFEKISLSGRPISLAANLTRTANLLNGMFEQRNKLIHNYANSNGMPAAIYFGLREKDRIDERYPSAIRGISQYTDDCIYFSHLLYLDLVNHGKALTERYGKNAPKVSSFNFQSAFDQKLIPAAEQYADWNRMFAEPKATKEAASQ